MKWLMIYMISYLLFLIGRYVIFSENQNYYLIIEHRQNWAIIHNGVAAYYLEVDSSIDTHWGDILWIDGLQKPIHITTYEGLFSFPNYLQQRGVTEAIQINQSDIWFRFPFRVDEAIEKRLLQLDSRLGSFVAQLLWKRQLHNDKFRESLNDLIQYSGLGFYLTNRWMNSILKLKFSDQQSRFIRLLFFFPYLLMNLRQMGMIRIYGIELIKYFYPKLHLPLMKVIVISVQSWMNPLMWNQESTYVYLMYQIFMMFFLGLWSQLSSWKRWLAFLVMSVTYRWFKEGVIFSLSSIWFWPLSLIHSVLFPFWVIYLYFGLSLPGLIFISNQWIGLLHNLMPWQVDFYSGEVHGWMQMLLGLLGILIGLMTWLKLTYHRNKLIISVLILISFQVSGVDKFWTSEVSFINVGQGDATLIRSFGKSMLIDTGGVRHFDMATEVLIPYFKRRSIHALDYLVITHPDFDHDGAMDSLLSNFPVRHVIKETFHTMSIGQFTIQNYQHFHQQLLEDNERSLVLGIETKHCRFLVMGDATVETENLIQTFYPDLTATILRIGHHGSNTSTSLSFLKQIQPKEVVISLGGGNRYGHPHQAVLQRLDTLNIPIRRTDIEGTIHYQTCKM